MKLLSAQSPAQPLSPQIRRLRMIGEVGAALIGTVIGVALSLAAAPASAHRHATPAAKLAASVPPPATTARAWPS